MSHAPRKIRHKRKRILKPIKEKKKEKKSKQRKWKNAQTDHTDIEENKKRAVKCFEMLSGFENLIHSLIKVQHQPDSYITS